MVVPGAEVFLCPGPNLRLGFQALGDRAQNNRRTHSDLLSPLNSVALHVPKAVLPSHLLLFVHVPGSCGRTSFCVLLRAEIKSDVSFERPAKFSPVRSFSLIEINELQTGNWLVFT